MRFKMIVRFKTVVSEGTEAAPGTSKYQEH